jgi:hypothetical protein
MEVPGSQIQISRAGPSGLLTGSLNQLGLPNLLRGAYTKGDDGEFISTDGECVQAGEGTMALTTMLCVMVLHGVPPESLNKDLAPPFQQIVEDGARLRARLPAYITQRRALIDTHCPLLPPLRDLVHTYEEPTTTDELAMGHGARGILATR